MTDSDDHVAGAERAPERKDKTMRDKIVSAIMELVKPPPMRTKPTLEELERILNSDDPPPFVIEPDGTMLSTPQSGTTVGAVADAVMRLLDADLSSAPADGQCFECGSELSAPICAKCNPEIFEARAPALAEECERLSDALRFIQDISGEELEHAKVGTGAEVALRHINRRAHAALSSTPAAKTEDER